MAALPDSAKGRPFGARIHAIATYLKPLQALSYRRLQQGAFADLKGASVHLNSLAQLLSGASVGFMPLREAAG
ncbi:hypothetical protein U1763_20430 [Sphingomonas sp. LB2R24]